MNGLFLRFCPHENRKHRHEEEAQRLFNVIRKEKIRLLYMKVAVAFGVLNPEPSDVPGLAAESAGEPQCGMTS